MKTFNIVNKSPPPIIINYLWGYQIRGQLKKIRSDNGLSKESLSYSAQIIDSYRALGWDIAVNNVGRVVNSTLLAKNIPLILDDGHHPSCGGVELISDMLQYTLYSNVADTCTKEDFPKTFSIHNDTQSIVPPARTVIGSINKEYLPSWTDLFQINTRPGSLSPWLPAAVNHSTNLHVAGYPESFDKFEIAGLGRSKKERGDRKNAYRVPMHGCLNFTLLEPELKWLGMSIQPTKPSTVDIYVNNVLVTAKVGKDWNKAIVYIGYWIDIPEWIPQKSDHYDVSICSNAVPNKRAETIQHIVGVMGPKLPIRKSEKPFSPNSKFASNSSSVEQKHR